MNLDSLRRSLILTGATGCGKTSLGVELAERLDAEIVSMDSMALYRGMNIGTAKPNAEVRGRVPYHLLDMLEPWESASVAWWLEEASRCAQDIERRGKRALIVGGTPLYLKALLRGFFEGPPADPAFRQRLAEEAARNGSSALHERLAGIDPTTAARLSPNDLRRIIRALEVWESTGRPISAFQSQWGKPAEAGDRAETGTADGAGFSRVLWLDLPRAELYARIDTRVLQMFDAGWLDEATALRNLPRPISKEASQALGYKEIFDYLDGKGSLAETIERIQTRTRNFAKRQLTWFRHLPECRPVTRELTFRAWGLTIDR